MQLRQEQKKVGWMERTFLSDFNNLHQQGLITKILFVPKIVINFVLDLAIKTSRFPVHYIN